MQTTARPGWLSRNWLWFVPAGCLSLVALVVLFAAGAVFVAGSAMKSTEPYGMALALAGDHPGMRQALGTPLEPGWMPSGSVSTNGPSGEANLAIDISGPRGSGTIYAVASKVAGQWRFSLLVAEIGATGQRINLLDENAPAPDIPRPAAADSDWD